MSLHFLTAFSKILKNSLPPALFACLGMAVVANAVSAPPTKIGGNVAYAYVNGSGAIDPNRSKNVAAFQGANGLYCFNLTFRPKSVLTTMAYDPTTSIFYAFIQAAVAPTPTFTCSNIPTPDSVAITYRSNLLGGTNSSEAGIPFYIYWAD